MKMLNEGFEQGVQFAIDVLKAREDLFSAEHKKFKAQIKFLEDHIEWKKVNRESNDKKAVNV